MRKLLVTMVAAGLVVGSSSLPASAGGGSLKVRRDGDDVSSVLDVRAVATDTFGGKLYFAVRLWNSFAPSDLDGRKEFIVGLLDTKRRGRADKYLYFYYDSQNNNRFECAVFNRDGGFKGERRAMTDETNQAIACVTPLDWYDIHKQVQFAVETYDNGFVDRAPNDGRYDGL